MFQKQFQSLIPRRSAVCSKCFEPFEPGDSYISLVIPEGETWNRTDHCPSCWEEMEKERGHVWRGEIPPKVEKPLSHDEKALALFRSLTGMEKSTPLLLILALYLERKGQIFRCGGPKKSPIRHYEVPDSGEVVAITLRPLSEEEEREVKKELAERLGTTPPD